MLTSSRVATDDVDEARDRLSDIYCPHRLDLPRPRSQGPFRCRQTGWRLPRLALFDLQYGGTDVRVDPVPFDEFVLVTQPLRGRFAVRAKGARAEQVAETSTGTIVTDAYGWNQLRWHDDCRVTNLVFDRVAFERVAAELCGYDRPRPVRFELGPAVGPGPAARWDAVSSLIRSQIMGGGSGAVDADPSNLVGSPLLQAELFRLGVAALLEAFPHSLPPNDARGPAFTAPAAVRRATSFVELNADRDIGLADIAAAARLSVRGLQAAYRRADLPSPLRQLRDTRLRCAHRELSESSPADTTVAAVAARWGFTNSSRFAAAHREMFGCRPIDTLTSR